MNIRNIGTERAAGADVNAKGNDGWTAMHWAAFGDHKDTVEWLITKGADINAKANDGWTPMRWADYMGHKDMVELLKKHGALESSRRGPGRAHSLHSGL